MPTNATNTARSDATARAKKVVCISERFRTRLCKTFRKASECPYGPRCMFAHGKAQLRTKRRNVADGLVSEAAVRAFQHGEIAAHTAAGATVPVGVACEPPAATNPTDLWHSGGSVHTFSQAAGGSLRSIHGSTEETPGRYIALERQTSSEGDDQASLESDGSATLLAAPLSRPVAPDSDEPRRSFTNRSAVAARFRHDPYSLVAPTKHAVSTIVAIAHQAPSVAGILASAE